MRRGHQAEAERTDKPGAKGGARPTRMRLEIERERAEQRVHAVDYSAGTGARESSQPPARANFDPSRGGHRISGSPGS